MWMLGLIMWGGCSSSGDIASIEDDKIPVAEVFALLDEAVEKSIAGDVEAALVVCDEALERFEVDVEPALRRVCGRVCTTSIEYDLGGLREAIKSRSEGQETILGDLETRVIHNLSKD